MSNVNVLVGREPDTRAETRRMFMTFLHALAELLVVARQDTTVWEKQFVTGLQPEANWLTAINKNLANQSLYNNVVKEILNGFLRNESLKNYQTSLTFYKVASFNKFLQKLNFSMISFSDPLAGLF